MNLGFQDMFEPFVLDGSKTHSIRAGDRWKVGMRADCYVRPRQKGMRLLFRAPVVKVEPIEIRAFSGGGGCIWIADTPLVEDELDLFAWRDGFRRTDVRPKGAPEHWGAFHLMMDYWIGTQRDFFSNPFKGQLVHWDYSQRRMTELARI